MKKTRNRKYMIGLGFLLIILGVFLVRYYQKNHKEVITLGVFTGSPWDVPDAYTYEFLEDAIAEFEDAHPNVTVKYISGIPKEEYSEWLSGKLVGGEAPDVFMILPEDFSTLKKVGALKKLDSFIKNEEAGWEDNYYESAYDFGSFQGSQYALPLESAPDMMFVNKTLLAKEAILMPDEDWTWEEFYEICKKVTKDCDGNGVIDQFGVYNYNWEHAFITNDVAAFDQDGTSCNIQGENAQEAVEFIKKLEELKNGGVVTSEDFDLGKVAFMPLSLAEYRTYKPYPWSIKKYSNFDWDCITLPRGPHGDNVSRMNTLLMGMNVRTRKTELSWELMKTFCYNEKIQLEIYNYREGGAVLRKILDENNAILIVNQELPKNGSLNIGMIHSIMENAQMDYNFSNANEAKDMISSGIVDIVNNDKNPKISLKLLQREINQYLNQ